LTAIPALISFLFFGCTEKPWQGKFIAPADNQCYLLEYIDIHGDATADVKYEALKESANFEAYFRDKDSMLFIRELNREWAFKLKSDTLFEMSNQDPYCFLVKEKN
jgi:hypothetical protein